MSRTIPSAAPRRRAPRSGLTLPELLISAGVMAMIAAALAPLIHSAQNTWQFGQRYGTAVQHARVALDRIQRAARSAYATADHPGIAVVEETVAGEPFPDTLVIWRPQGTPANPDGPPLIRECVFYCPDPDSPNHLLEITAPGDARPIPLNDELNTPAWRQAIRTLKTAPGSQRQTLTALLRCAPLGSGTQASLSSEDSGDGFSAGQPRLNDGDQFRGMIRFVRRLTPSAAEWEAYQRGEVDFEALPWPQDLYGRQFGMRQVWLRIELQLAGGSSPEALTRAAQSLPFFGSAVCYYPLRREAE